MVERALEGRRVLVTRAREQSSALREGLEALGAEVVSIPVIEIVPPASWAEMDGALGEGGWEWLVLTSANAAESVAGRLEILRRPAEFPQVAAVGAATAARARVLGLARGEVVLGKRAVAESLAEAMETRVRRGARVLLPRAERTREVLPERLRAVGAEVVTVTAYRNRVPEVAVEALRSLFGARERWPAAVSFSSSSSVTGLLGALREAGMELPGEVRCISIGEITTTTMRACGVRVDGEAREASVAGLVEAVVQAMG